MRNQNRVVFLLSAAQQSITAAPWEELSSSRIPGEVPMTKSLQQPLLSHSQPHSTAGASEGHSPFTGRLHTPGKDSQQSPKSSRRLRDKWHPLRSPGCRTPPHAPGMPISLPMCLQQLSASPNSLRLFHSSTYLQYLPALTI